MKKIKILAVLLSIAAGLLAWSGCAVNKDPFGPTLAASLFPLVKTNVSLLFTGPGALDGFAATPYSTAQMDGGVENNYGTNLFVWITNASRGRGNGWFWGGFAEVFTNPTNLYGSPPEYSDWTLIINMRSVSTNFRGKVMKSRPMNFQITATNLQEKKKGVLKFVSPTAVPFSDTQYLLRATDFTLSGTMGSAAEVLSQAGSMGFMIDNAQIADGDSFGYLIDYLVIGYK